MFTGRGYARGIKTKANTKASTIIILTKTLAYFLASLKSPAPNLLATNIAPPPAIPAAKLDNKFFIWPSAATLETAPVEIAFAKTASIKL